MRRGAAIRAVWVAVATVATGTACPEEALQTLEASLSVCAEEEAPAKECDRPFAIGEVPVTVPVPIVLFARNRGDGTLDLREVTSNDEAVTVGELPEDVRAGLVEPVPLSIELPADALGARTARLTFSTNDAEQPVRTVELQMVGVPVPAPRIEVCSAPADDGEPVCGVDLDLSFGVVRRSQQQGLTLRVHNRGDAPLSIEEVRLESNASVADEIVIASSTRPAELSAGDDAPLVVVYRPMDGGADDATLIIASDDPETPEVRIALSGSSPDNAPPTASALESLTQTSDVEVVVDDLIQIDGTGSLDPEGDPLEFSWQLSAPIGSSAALVDDGAQRASFAPDVAGDYTVTLVVADSLGQQSEPAVVTLSARSRYGLRVQLLWPDDGDLDLHVVAQGASLFGALDCAYHNRDVDFGVAGAVDDDCHLIDDATGPPGPEQAVMVAPAGGTYEVWVKVFEDAGGGPIEATVRLVADDAAAPIYSQQRMLAGACTSWHVADVTYPGPVVVNVDALGPTDCP